MKELGYGKREEGAPREVFRSYDNGLMTVFTRRIDGHGILGIGSFVETE